MKKLKYKNEVLRQRQYSKEEMMAIYQQILRSHVFGIDGGRIVRSLRLKEYTIPNGVEKIDNKAFMWCDSLEKLVIPEGVKMIGRWAFALCKNLSDIKLPSTLYHIGKDAFSKNLELTHLVIPKRVGFIGTMCFRDCINLEEIVFEGKTMEKIKSMRDYPWGIENPEEIIVAENSQEKNVVDDGFWESMVENWKNLYLRNR